MILEKVRRPRNERTKLPFQAVFFSNIHVIGGYCYEQPCSEYQQSCYSSEPRKLHRRGMPLLSGQLSLDQYCFCCDLFSWIVAFLSGVLTQLWLQLSSCGFYGDDPLYLFHSDLSDPAESVDPL